MAKSFVARIKCHNIAQTLQQVITLADKEVVIVEGTDEENEE